MAENEKDEKGKEQPQDEKEAKKKPELSPYPQFKESVSEEVPRQKGGLPDMPQEEETDEEEGADGSESKKSDEKAKAAKDKEDSATSTEDEKKKKSESKPEKEDEQPENKGDDEELPEGAKKRIDQVTARAHKAERSNTELKKQVEQQAQEIAEFKKGKGDEDKGGDEDETGGDEFDIKPDPDDPEPKQENYPNDEGGWDEYHKEVRAWDRRQILKAVNQQNEQSEESEQQKTAEQQYNERVSEVLEQGKKLHEDFEEVAQGEILYDNQLPIVLRSDKAAEILYHLGTNPEEAERLSGIADQVDFAREIGKLEVRFSSSEGEGSGDDKGGSEDDKSKEQDTKSKRKSSSASEPLESIGGRSKVTKDPNDMTTDEYYEAFG